MYRLEIEENKKNYDNKNCENIQTMTVRLLCVFISVVVC